jgi:hypothetical protein
VKIAKNQTHVRYGGRIFIAFNVARQGHRSLM